MWVSIKNRDIKCFFGNNKKYDTFPMLSSLMIVEKLEMVAKDQKDQKR